ncbi:MAG: DinB family protein [Gemmatimonadota bacterium]
MPEPGRPQPGEYNAYYQKYIDLVPEGDIRMVLRVQLADTIALLRPVSEQQSTHRYAEGKWSVKQVIGHLIDGERIFLYRANCIARGDRSPLPGFDENTYAEAGGFDGRPFQSLLAELEAARGSTASFFQNLPDDAWRRLGIANNLEISVRALAYITAGHELHHRAILAERYLGAAVPA